LVRELETGEGNLTVCMRNGHLCLCVSMTVSADQECPGAAMADPWRGLQSSNVS